MIPSFFSGGNGAAFDWEQGLGVLPIPPAKRVEAGGPVGLMAWFAELAASFC